MEVQSCSKEIGAGAALENCRRLINQINTWLSAEEPFVMSAPRAAKYRCRACGLVLFVPTCGC